MEISTVDKSQIREASRFAQNVFIDYYNGLIGNSQATYMADLFLSEEAIEKLIDDGAIFKVVKDQGDILGFTEYKKEDERFFLSKLYVEKNHRHQGIGRMMFNDCLNHAIESNISKIYLTVNKHNTPSYDTYIHLGFKVIDAVENDIGNGYIMDDYIMEYIIQ